MLTFIVCLTAGLGAGIGTGLAGLSAAAVISPMLVTFLKMKAYDAVGIALASDVLASAISAYTYKKNHHIDIRHGIFMLCSVLLFTMAGSYASSFMPNTAMGNFSVFMTLLLGLKFLIFPVTHTREFMEGQKESRRIAQSLIGGMVIGFICGFVGAGGGMMMLLILTTILGYELKTAVGTSVFIMTFTAFTGSVSHFYISGKVPEPIILLLCVIFTFLGARFTAVFANQASTKTLNRITGLVLLLLGILMVAVNAC